MSEIAHNRRKEDIRPEDVQGTKYLMQIIDLLAPLREHRPDPKRCLHYDEFCAWLLLYFFTPVLTSMRGLQQASDLPALQRKLNLPRFSLGSFSEAGNIFDPALLEPIMTAIGDRLKDIEPDKRLCPNGLRPTAVDGTMLHALPKMVWALWRNDGHHAARLHLQLDLLRGAPERATVSGMHVSESRTLERNLQPGRLYIADRGFFDYNLMQSILNAESSFVTRVRESVVNEVVEERPIGEEAVRAGVQRDAVVRVGSKPCEGKIDRPLRLVQIYVTAPPPRGPGPKPVDRKTKMYREHATEHTVVLLTDLIDLDVLHIALLYRHRWQIELFFRWFKKVLQADRPLALSENGMTLVIYCALIASMLVVLWTGRKPAKRTYEMFCFYLTGWADDDDMRRHLKKLAAADQKTA